MSSSSPEQNQSAKGAQPTQPRHGHNNTDRWDFEIRVRSRKITRLETKCGDFARLFTHAAQCDEQNGCPLVPVQLLGEQYLVQPQGSQQAWMQFDSFCTIYYYHGPKLRGAPNHLSCFLGPHGAKDDTSWLPSSTPVNAIFNWIKTL